MLIQEKLIFGKVNSSKRYSKNGFKILCIKSSMHYHCYSFGEHGWTITSEYSRTYLSPLRYSLQKALLFFSIFHIFIGIGPPGLRWNSSMIQRSHGVFFTGQHKVILAWGQLVVCYIYLTTIISNSQLALAVHPTKSLSLLQL